MASAFTSVAHKIFGSKNDRELKRMTPLVEQINGLEEKISKETDDGLRGRIAEWKSRISAIEDIYEREDALWEVLPEVFAVVREASKRTLGQRHFYVQVIGGMMFHPGTIPPMKNPAGTTPLHTLP